MYQFLILTKQSYHSDFGFYRGGAGGGGDADGGSLSAVMTARAKQTVDGLMSRMDMGDECAWLASRGGGAWYAEGPGEHS